MCEGAWPLCAKATGAAESRWVVLHQEWKAHPSDGWQLQRLCGVGQVSNLSSSPFPSFGPRPCGNPKCGHPKVSHSMGVCMATARCPCVEFVEGVSVPGAKQ